MRVVIRKSPPLFGRRSRSASRVFGRLVAILLAFTSLGCGYWSVRLLLGGLGEKSLDDTAAVIERWHVWLAGSIAAAVISRIAWGPDQRPTNRE